MSRAYSPTDWVTLVTCTWPHEAYLIRALLEDRGISAAVADEHMSSGMGSIALGGVRVMVRLTDRERAELAIAEQPSDESPDESSAGVT
jgi:hypothetical protein